VDDGELDWNAVEFCMQRGVVNWTRVRRTGRRHRLADGHTGRVELGAGDARRRRSLCSSWSAKTEPRTTGSSWLRTRRRSCG